MPVLAEFMSDLRKLIPSAHSLLVFEAVARLQSFKAAAIEMHVTQPSVSHAIRAMEDRLGLRLFERGNRGVRLTRAGSELMADLAPALRQIENRLRSIVDRESRTITVAASTSASAQWLLPVTAQFQRETPGVSVRIITTDRNVEPGSEIDLTIRRGPKNWKRKNCWHLSDEVLYTICSPAYLEKAGPVHGLADLKNHATIHNAEPFRDRMQWQEWLERQGCAGVNLPETLILNDYQLVIQACIAGEGIALGWSFTTQGLVDQGVLVRPIENKVATDFAFYALGSEDATYSGNKLRYIEWITGNAKQSAMAESISQAGLRNA